MNHSDRSFSFKEIGREDDLAKAMTEHKWPLCYSFLFGKLLYINDGNSEDLPEYVAVAIEDTGGASRGLRQRGREDQAARIICGEGT